jgi:hypothetical protein
LQERVCPVRVMQERTEAFARVVICDHVTLLVADQCALRVLPLPASHYT